MVMRLVAFSLPILAISPAWAVPIDFGPRCGALFAAELQKRLPPPSPEITWRWVQTAAAGEVITVRLDITAPGGVTSHEGFRCHIAKDGSVTRDAGPK